MNIKDRIEFFGLKNQRIEYELQKLQDSGIDVGYQETNNKKTVDTAVFPAEIIHDSKTMSEYYKIYYIVENSLRLMIRDTLSEKNAEWIKQKIPDDLISKAEKFRHDEEEFGIEPNTDLLSYFDFGDLITILKKNEKDFQNISDMNKAMTKLTTLKNSRNMIAHCRRVDEREFDRIKLAVEDWAKIAY